MTSGQSAKSTDPPPLTSPRGNRDSDQQDLLLPGITECAAVCEPQFGDAGSFCFQPPEVIALAADDVRGNAGFLSDMAVRGAVCDCLPGESRGRPLRKSN